MADLSDDDLVLVAVVKTPRDLEIARVLGWYRIPLSRAPGTMRVDWLAFFQGAAFGDERWSVRYLAEVRGYELTTRGDLLREEAAHPRSREPYYRLQLGPLQALAEPIPARRWRRFTFLYTTGERVRQARDVRDLTMPSASRREPGGRRLRESRQDGGRRS
ncbi:MAG TPA: hypothetical protein VLD63_02270 [Anaerolineales bacterium]|nr:hypothetical protein [Anaerolineales bacterium]